MSAPLILVIDDEEPLLRLLKLELGQQGYEVVVASTGAEGLATMEERAPELVLLDYRMLDMDGLEVLQRIRAISDVPVIMLSAFANEDVKVRAMQAGADDFVSKPFLVARLEDSIRYILGKGRGEASSSSLLSYGTVEIDLQQRQVRNASGLVPLTRSEWLLIEQLARTPGEPRLYQELLSRVWGPEYRDDLAFLRVVIDRVNDKISDGTGGPGLIRPYLGVGYYLSSKAD